MRVYRAVAEQPIGVLIGFVAASVLFLLALGLAFTGGRALATHDGTSNIHACVNVESGRTSIVLPGETPNCRGNEQLVELASGAGLAELEARVDALETENAAQQDQIDELFDELSELDGQVPDCLTEESGDADLHRL